MPEANSVNISPSPLAALYGTGSAGVAAQAGTGDTTGGADSFQTMLAAQGGESVNPAPPAATPPASVTTAAALTLVAPVAPAPSPVTQVSGEGEIVSAPASVVTTMAALGLNGNLPGGGKILPGGLTTVGLTMEDSADGAQDTPAPTPATVLPETARPAIAKTINATPRTRRNAEGEVDQDVTAKTSAKPAKVDRISDQDASDEEDDVNGTVTPDLTASDPTPSTPDQPSADPMVQDGALSGITLSITPAPVLPAQAPVQSAAPSGSDEAITVQATGTANISSAPIRPAMASQVVSIPSPAQNLEVSAPVLPESAPKAAKVSPDGVTGTTNLSASGLGTPAQATVIPADPRLPDQVAASMTPINLTPFNQASTTDASPAVNITGLAQVDSAAAIQPALVQSGGVSENPGEVSSATSGKAPARKTAAAGGNLSPVDTGSSLDRASPLLRDTLSPLTSQLSAVSGSSPSQADLAAGYESSRDMSALVDRLVEARAAMRSGTPTQWVQTTIQHAEFGRVALQIRQDGDNLSVAMTSNDPGFAPAATAALHGSASLLQPAVASQNSSDMSQDNRQPGQQAQGNNGNPLANHFGHASSGGQNSGQNGGQNGGQARQQPAFPADNLSIALTGQARAETGGSAPSTRSGILA